MAVDPRMPFTRRAGLKAGIPVRELNSAAYRRLFHGVYVGSQVKVTVALRAKAALLVCTPATYASHHTAARLWGGWAPPTVQIHVASPSHRSRSERGGIASHRAPEGVVPIMRSGVPTCPPTQVFLDLAAEGIDLVDLVAVGDSLVSASAVTPEALIDAAASWVGAGCRLARRAARWVRAGVDSVMETRVRMLIVLAGLPEPTVDHVIRRDDGTWLHRIDLAYLGLMIAVEYDGRQHAENTTRWNKDIRRREDLENQGWRFVIVTAEGVFAAPEETLERIRRILRDRGESAGRRRPSVEWHRCFPGRPTD